MQKQVNQTELITKFIHIIQRQHSIEIENNKLFKQAEKEYAVGMFENLDKIETDMIRLRYEFTTNKIEQFEIENQMSVFQELAIQQCYDAKNGFYIN